VVRARTSRRGRRRGHGLAGGDRDAERARFRADAGGWGTSRRTVPRAPIPSGLAPGAPGSAGPGSSPRRAGAAWYGMIKVLADGAQSGRLVRSSTFRGEVPMAPAVPQGRGADPARHGFHRPVSSFRGRCAQGEVAELVKQVRLTPNTRRIQCGVAALGRRCSELGKETGTDRRGVNVGGSIPRRRGSPGGHHQYPRVVGGRADKGTVLRSRPRLVSLLKRRRAQAPEARGAAADPSRWFRPVSCMPKSSIVIRG
jgi:hypothetical protein